MAFPGLKDALEKLDETSDQMAAIVTGLDKIAVLLEEQNELLRNN